MTAEFLAARHRGKPLSTPTEIKAAFSGFVNSGLEYRLKSARDLCAPRAGLAGCEADFLISRERIEQPAFNTQGQRHEDTEGPWRALELDDQIGLCRYG